MKNGFHGSNEYNGRVIHMVALGSIRLILWDLSQINISKGVWMGATYWREEGAPLDSTTSKLVLRQKKSGHKRLGLHAAVLDKLLLREVN